MKINPNFLNCQVILTHVKNYFFIKKVAFLFLLISAGTLFAAESERPTNPTAPNFQTGFLSADFTDTDQDGMTDAEELLCGYDPNNPASFPQEPQPVVPVSYNLYEINNQNYNLPLINSGINAVYDLNVANITIRWKDPPTGNYSLKMMKGSQLLFFGGHKKESVQINYDVYGLKEGDALMGTFYEYDQSGSYLQEYPVFNLILPTLRQKNFISTDLNFNAKIEIVANGLILTWVNPVNCQYYLILTNDKQTLYNKNRRPGIAPVLYNQFGLSGNERLYGYFVLYENNQTFILQTPDFFIDLQQYPIPEVGETNNRISYSFKDFPADSEQAYRNFLKKVFPIMYRRLGPPAESFNCVITNMGEDTGYFMTIDNGRTFLSDTEFIPRLIVHELIHAWKGRFLFASDQDWNYEVSLNGFEEASAEGMAFEIMHEYVRAYPTDTASSQLLQNRPHQYWSMATTYHDLIKFRKATGGGDFWNGYMPDYDYSIAATTFQYLVKENPDVYKLLMQKYYAIINQNPGWRSNRSDMISMWKEIVPQINGVDTGIYLNALPVFQGHKLNSGIYVLNIIYPAGITGPQYFTASYANNEGMLWWGIINTKIATSNIPSWIKFDPGSKDSYYYVDVQNQPFTVTVYDMANTLLQTNHDQTVYDRINNREASGLGWKNIDALNAAYFPVGLYRETVSFDNYLLYDPKAVDSFYFIGTSGLSQNLANDYIIIIGIDGVLNGTIKITLQGKDYTEPIVNGAAVFRSKSWPFDLEGQFPITVTINTGIHHTYYRTLLEAGTFNEYFQHQFIIIDKDFNGIEDPFEQSYPDIPTPTATAFSSPTPVPTVTPAKTALSSVSPSPTPIKTNSPTPVPTLTPTPTATKTVTASPTPAITPTNTPFKTASVTSTPVPTATPISSPPAAVIISGVKNGYVYSNAVSVTWDDAGGTTNIATLTINNIADSYQKGTLISENGRYQLIVITKNNDNELTASTSVQFTIQKPPVPVTIIGISNGGIYKTDVSASWVDEPYTTNTATLTKDNISMKYEKDTLITDNGIYQLIVATKNNFNGLATTASVQFKIQK